MRPPAAAMQWLSDNGYTTVFLSQLSDYEETGAPLPEKPVVVTLDDGYENNLTLVLPILEKLDLRATVSVVGSFSLDTADTRCHLDLADVKTLADSGRVEIGSHTYAMSWCVDLVGEYGLTTFDGGWIGEARRHVTPVEAARVVNESTAGFSSNRHNPGFLLAGKGAGEDCGDVYGFNLIYSGNHYASAQRSFQGLTRVMQGVSPALFCAVLAPGGTFETPEGVLAYSGAGFNGLSAAMHRFVNGHIIPPAWRYRPRPVLFNDWEGCMMSSMPIRSTLSISSSSSSRPLPAASERACFLMATARGSDTVYTA